MPAFRVHFEGGEPFDCIADTPEKARAIALSRRTGKITKIKIVKENAE